MGDSQDCATMPVAARAKPPLAAGTGRGPTAKAAKKSSVMARAAGTDWLAGRSLPAALALSASSAEMQAACSGAEAIMAATDCVTACASGRTSAGVMKTK